MDSLTTATDQALVTAYDGTIFYCHVESTGARAPERQWIFEMSAVRYRGPAFLGPLTPDKIRDVVNAWWHEKTHSAQDQR